MKAKGQLSKEVWQKVVSRSEYATFFHTPAWAQIISRTYPNLNIATKSFVLDDGVVAVVPLVSAIERNRYFRWCESMNPGVYGGPVAERILTQKEMSWIFQHLVDRRTSRIYLNGNPYSDYDSIPGCSRSQQFTQVLRLDKGFDTLLKNYSRGHKADAKRAKRMGVKIDVAQSEAEYRSYYEVYEDSLERWGDRALVIYPYKLFEQAYRIQSETIKLWVARVNGQIVSGSLVFYHNRHAVCWHGATLRSHFSHSPSHLLYTEIIKDACQRGFKHFDFNPSGGLEGAERFKKSFGAQKLFFYAYELRNKRQYAVYQKLRGLGRILLKWNPNS